MNGARPDWRALIVLTTLAALGLIGVRPARAQTKEGAWFLLRIDPCVSVDPEAVAQQMAIELGPLHSRTRPGVGLIKLDVSCQGAQTLMQAYCTTSGLVLVRTMNLYLQPSQIRERILALTLAELLATSASEEESESTRGEESKEEQGPPAGSAEPDRVGRGGRPPIHQSPPSPPRPFLPGLAPPERAVQGSTTRLPFPSLRVLALTTGQSFSNGPLFLWGGGVGVGWDSSRHVGLFVDLLARHGSVPLDLGTISVNTGSVGAALLFWHGWSRLRLRAGAGLRGGLVHLHGEPTDSAKAKGDTFFGGWLGPVLTLGFTVDLGERAALEFSAEGGHVLVPVIGQARGESAAQIAGPFWGLQLGVGIFP